MVFKFEFIIIPVTSNYSNNTRWNFMRVESMFVTTMCTMLDSAWNWSNLKYIRFPFLTLFILLKSSPNVFFINMCIFYSKLSFEKLGLIDLKKSIFTKLLLKFSIIKEVGKSIYKCFIEVEKTAHFKGFNFNPTPTPWSAWAVDW